MFMPLNDCLFPPLPTPTPSHSSSIPSLLDVNVFKPVIRFFTIKRVDTTETFHDVSPFETQHGIRYHIGTPKHVKKLRDGSLLLEVSSDDMTQKMLKLRSFGSEFPLCVEPHKTLNSSKGVIFCPELMDMQEQEILSELREQNVSEIKRIHTRKDGVLKPSPLLILTFKTTILPDHIFVGYIRVDVRRHVPNPMRCLNCQKYGHIQTNCKNSFVCPKCGKSDAHVDKPCDEKASCINCGDNHPAWSRECPVWMREKKVMEIKTNEGLSYSEARKRLQLLSPNFRPEKSFAAATTTPVIPQASKQIQPPELEHLTEMMSLLLAGQKENKDKLDIQTRKIDEQTIQIQQLLKENLELKAQNQKMKNELTALQTHSNTTPTKQQQPKKQQQPQQKEQQHPQRTVENLKNTGNNTKIPKLDVPQTSDEELTEASGKKMHDRISFHGTDEDDESEPMEMDTNDLRRKLVKKKGKK
jgi:Zn finger protein HypA/HybF involved in hydrogenase expression/regulator of replication initiation timing